MQQSVIGQTQRIRSIDIVRGIAVLGIFTMNAADMAYPQDLVLDFRATDPDMGWNYWVAFTSEVLFSGKMRGLFTLLFGVSSVLIVERLTRKVGDYTAADYYFRRLIWLLVLGLANAYIFLWWGDVLFKYALLGMLLFPFRQASNKILTVAMLTCIAVLTVQPYTDYRDIADLEQQYISVQSKQRSAQPLTPDDYEVVNDWQEILADNRPDSESIEEEIRINSGNYAVIFNYNTARVFEENTSIFYAEDVWDMMLFMLLGIMLLRMKYFDEQLPPLVHMAIALFGIGVGLYVHVWLNLGVSANYLDPVTSLYYLTFYDLGRVPFVVGYMSLTILIFRSEIFKYIGDGMAAVGRMALSNYLMQSIIGAFVFYGFGLAQFNQMSRLDLAAFVFLVWIFQVTFSVVWMRLFYYGPVEWLWRSLTYWETQPLRRTQMG